MGIRKYLKASVICQHHPARVRGRRDIPTCYPSRKLAKVGIGEDAATEVVSWIAGSIRYPQMGLA